MLNTKSWSSSSSPHLGLILLGKVELHHASASSSQPEYFSSPFSSLPCHHHHHQIQQEPRSGYLYIFIYLPIFYLLIFGCDGPLLLLGLFLAAASGGLLVAVCRLLIVAASLLWDTGSRAQGLQPGGSQAVERRLSSCGAG